MRTITQKKLNKILEKHKSYIMGIDGGERANLYGVNLCGADLSYANLYGANLYGVNLYGADLHGANLYGVNLCGADLHGANLCYANLHGANLHGANLSYANLYGADLHGVNLYGANLCGADLYGANLCGSDLSYADLSYADLHGADLCGSDLSCANISKALLDEKEQFRKGVILEKPMRGYKKLSDGSICVLSIPKGAIVFSINGSKCRTNKAKVLEGGGVSCCDNEFTYEKGKTYEIKDFDLAYNEECSTGIHFFVSFEEARDY